MACFSPTPRIWRLAIPVVTLEQASPARSLSVAA
jgi:hypothetical protein